MSTHVRSSIYFDDHKKFFLVELILLKLLGVKSLAQGVQPVEHLILKAFYWFYQWKHLDLKIVDWDLKHQLKQTKS